MRVASPVLTPQKTCCRTLCCALCAPTAGCVTPITSARGSTGSSPTRPWTTTAPPGAGRSRPPRCRRSAAPQDPTLDDFEELIGGLPDRARSTLRLRFVDDLEYDAIAVQLDITPEAARARVSHALKTLRKELA